MNTSLFNLIHNFAGRSFLFDNLMIFFADYFGYIFIAWAAILILSEKKSSRKIYFSSLTALTLIISWGIITEILKKIIGYPRPFMALNFTPLINENKETYMSFPSGHATFYFALATAMFYLNKKNSRWFFAGATLISVARIFTGVHWPLDILAGALIGIGTGILVKKILPVRVEAGEAHETGKLN